MIASRAVASVPLWVGFLTQVALAVSIETVPVGNPGNGGDNRYFGNGSVNYMYNIGKYEVTAGQYAEFLNAVAGVDTYALYSTGMSRTDNGSGITRHGGGTMGDPFTYAVAPSHVNRPVNCVSWGDAARFVNWLHNGQPTGAQDLGSTEDGAYYLNGAVSYSALVGVARENDWKWAITSEDEWYKAAYHKNDGVSSNYWSFATSSNSMPGRDLADASGNNANYYGTPYPIQPLHYTTIAGEFENSVSPYGTFDQCGNLWEWNESVISGTFRGRKGGAFDWDGSYLHAATRVGSLPSNESVDTGFRVSELPEPGSIALLMAGGIRMLVRRRRTGR